MSKLQEEGLNQERVELRKTIKVGLKSGISKAEPENFFKKIEQTLRGKDNNKISISTKAAKAIIKNVKEEILFVQGNKNKHKKLLWDLPGGLVDSSENEEKALLRELKEELGVEAQIINKGKKWKFFRPLDGQWVSMQNYMCTISERDIILSDEHGKYSWVSLEELKNFPKRYPIKSSSLLKALE